MKRHAALAHLSDDHHRALRLARDLEEAGRDGESAARRAIAKLEEAWRIELRGHFAWEERWFERLLADTPELAQLLAEHWSLKQHVEPLVNGAAATELAPRVGHIGSLLRAHVRWEERVLLPLVERVADEADLSQMKESADHPPSGF